MLIRMNRQIIWGLLTSVYIEYISTVWYGHSLIYKGWHDYKKSPSAVRLIYGNSPLPLKIEMFSGKD